ncbi:hypothetical protein BJY04DRAFT_216250 [Aspergillus karnatakaensis]|uniref:uncharacterized protein n=1 Tax=Aspergillus karnatakaensis TaxID=1810916 RepID=UPI003CCE3271
MATDPESLGILDWSHPNTERLFDKALNSPAEITQEEKHKIAEWIPSRAEMEVRTQKYLNQSYMMIAQGFHLLRELDHRALQAKWEQARAAVLSDTELRAVLSATDPSLRLRLDNEYFEPRQRARGEAQSRPAPWIQKIINQGGEKSWGYVVYCQSLDGSTEWERFHHRYDQIFGEAPVPALGTEEIRHTKVVDFVRFDGQENDFGGVKTDFRALREQGRLKPGVLSNVVLCITTECRDSPDEAMYSWLWALDPDWSIDRADEDGYDGKVPVQWAVCFDKLYNFISMGTFTLKDIWREFHQRRQRSLIPG